MYNNSPYYSGFATPYMYPLNNQMPPPAPQQQFPPQESQSNGGLVWVQGEAGAKAYPVAPNKTVMLMNSEGSEFYIKSADASGMPLPLRVFDFAERKTDALNAAEKPLEMPLQNSVKYATVEELQALQSDFEALSARLESINNNIGGRTPRRGKEVAENE